ncbi:hypothetical protein RIF29_05417 [Crotalaria pallida]|uniref:Uncharacterized protein n=1 Tax=Crotalaria pallida TaxID=3830 RepID=A0AAN9J3H0_CROPI
MGDYALFGMADLDRNSNAGDNQRGDNIEDEIVDETEWTRIDSTDDFVNIDFKTLIFEDMMKFSFGNFELGYEFYNAYGGLRVSAHHRQNICKFIEQLERCWELMRYNELRADFKTLDSQPTFVTPFNHLEKSAAGIYTREDKVFVEIQELERSGVGTNETVHADVNMSGVNGPLMTGPESAGKHCSRCHARGHNVRRYPMVLGNSESDVIIEDDVDYTLFNDYEEEAESDMDGSSYVNEDDDDVDDSDDSYDGDEDNDNDDPYDAMDVME